MKISLLTFLTVCLCSLNSLSQTNALVDTAKIKPPKVSVSDDLWSPVFNPERTFFNPFVNLFKEKEFNILLYADVKVKITKINKNARYRLYLKNIANRTDVLISDRWTYDNCDSSATISIDRKLFKKPFKYYVSIIPMAKLDGKTYTVLNDKFTYGGVFSRARASFDINEEYRVKGNYIRLWAFFAYVIIIIVTMFRIRSFTAEKQKEKAQLQLDAVRSQLNPHFLFNALAGIQNLMNTNQSEQANRYLTRFARLTRAVLKSNDLISLDEEINLLDDYLQMEQLRFNFKYEIKTNAILDINNTEIPSMLLQPFIENAVKHGIASLGSDGQIDIAIFPAGSDIILKIEDNGKGFDTSKTYEGLGFDLSTKRIALLNKIYKKDPILLQMESNPGKTTITITLTKWL